ALVATLTVPPALTPFCAFCELVSTLNSCIASGNGSGRLTPSYQLLWGAPSSRYCTPNCWPPATAMPRLWVKLRLDRVPRSTPPPAKTTREATLRPASGSASTCALLITCPTAGLRVSTSGVDEVTVIVSPSSPSCKVIGITGLPLPCSTTRG